ncbi:MAG: hypothetical protein ACXWV0_06325 [Flavisolibacter sp.]
MKKIIFIVLTAISNNVQAQPEYVDRIGFKLESIADIDIGWMKKYKPETSPKGKQLGNRTYSAKQISNSQQFIEWMQQSYLPKGCLGDIGYYQNYIPKFSGTNSRLGNEINTHGHALPHMYGAYSRMYMFLKKDAQGKFVPQNNFAEFWQIEVNQLENISFPVSFISSAEEYYFVLPDFNGHPKGYDEDDKGRSDLKGFKNHKSLQGHQHFYIPPKTINDNSHFVVIMTKNNELPFEKITIGEFFTQVEKKLPEWQKIDPVSADNYALALKNLARLKDKYKKKWNDIAELRTTNTQIDLYDFVNLREDNYDMFDNKDIYGKEGIYTTFPIQKVKKSTLALCKTDEPQWAVIRWTLGMPRQSFNLHLHESILNNFNFEYAYNYLFNPDKVKGQAYKPLRSPSFKEAVVTRELSPDAKKNATDKNIHFFEDFSSTTSGKPPVGWKAEHTADGLTCVVVQPEGVKGMWAMMNGDYSITPSHLKKPLPENFIFSFDVAASQNFTWGAKGMTLRLSKETSPGNAESYLSIKLRPGFDGRDGETTLETKFPFPAGYPNETKWAPTPGFSNNKKFNQVSVTLKKSGEKLQVLIDEKEVIVIQKALPASHLFNAISFYTASAGENNKYYISNIKVTKN